MRYSNFSIGLHHMWTDHLNSGKGALIRRYKSADLLKLVQGTNANFENTFKRSLEYTVPADILKLGLLCIRTLRGLDFTGARYLLAYLSLLDYKAYKIIKDADFLLLGVTLRRTLSVIYKTLKRYVMEAWRALKILGIQLRHPQRRVCFQL